MKMRKAIKKVVALSAGVTMLGATLMGATATLSDYPEPFVKDGVANAVVVVGEQAKTSDVVGAIDIAASLQAKAVSEKSVAVSGDGISVLGGEDRDVELGETAQTTLTDKDLPTLLDSDIDFNDDDYDVEEKIYADPNLMVQYSLNSGADDEFGSEPYLVTNALGALEYKYEFKDPVNISEVGEGAGEDTLEISFLGKNIEITEVKVGEFTVKSSNEYFTAVGDVINSDGHTVTLINVGSDAAVVKVDGQTKTVTPGSPVTFDEAGDYKVEVSDIFYVDEKEDRSATLTVGDDITTSIKADETSGDSLELFGYSDEEDESDWLWTMELDGSDEFLESIGVIHNFIQNNKVATDADERPAVALGERIEFPNDYAFVEATSLETDVYETLTVDFKTESLDGLQYDVVRFTHSGDDELFTISDGTIANTYESDTIWAVYNESITNVTYWVDDDGDDVKVADATNFTFVIDQDETMITFDNETMTFNVAVADVESYDFAVSAASSGNHFNDYFGASEGDAESTELNYTTNSVTQNIGTEDESILSRYGVKAEAPEDMMDDDKLELEIPEEQQMMTVVFGTEATSVAGSSGSATTESVNVIGVGLGVLDSDVTVGSQNMIVVGGPCVNTVAAELMGNPANCAEGFEMGKAMIKLFENNGKSAMLVAGYSALDTQGATRVVSQYDKYDLSGNEASVVVTSLNSISVE